MKVVLWTSMALVSLSTLGCATDYERYADAACACKEKQCADDVAKALAGKLKADPRSAKEIVVALSDRDREALKRGDDCGAKLK
ncbi:MAG: hypothetical protein U0414_28215 [Polyangiaceae bacterium]